MARVLIVEDDLNVLETFRKTILTLNHEVATAASLERAKDAIMSGTKFDIILADFWLHGASIVPLLDLISKEAPDSAVIIVSGGGGEISLEMTKAIGEISGAIRFIQKPFRRAEIEAAMQAALAAR